MGYVFKNAILLWYVKKKCPRASHGTGKCLKQVGTIMYPFSSVYKTLSREVQRHGEGVFTINMLD